MLLLFKRSLSSSARYMRTIFHSSEPFSPAQLASLEQRPAGGLPAAAPARAQSSREDAWNGRRAEESLVRGRGPTLRAVPPQPHAAQFVCSSRPHGGSKDTALWERCCGWSRGHLQGWSGGRGPGGAGREVSASPCVLNT